MVVLGDFVRVAPQCAGDRRILMLGCMAVIKTAMHGGT
jgi:hypothetical protein